jgi:hypothetical protein
LGKGDGHTQPQIAQGFAVDQLHDHGELVFMVEGGMELGDVDVVEGGQGLHFAAEALHHFGRALIGEENLHRFAAFRDEVLDLIDFTETPGAQLSHHLVVADPLSG